MMMMMMMIIIIYYLLFIIINIRNVIIPKFEMSVVKLDNFTIAGSWTSRYLYFDAKNGYKFKSRGQNTM